MSSDEYSEDVPGEEDLYGTIGGGCGDATSSVVSAGSLPDPRTSSGANVPSSYRSMSTNEMVMDSNMNVGMFGDNSNQNIMVEGPFDTNSQQQLDSSTRQQKRKYVRRKIPDERKRRGPRAKDLNAPRMPLNGYVRFLNANRERLKQENPDLTFAEVTKKLASEWSSMNPEEKKIYLDEAEKDKEIYLKQLHEYQRSESYQEFMEMKQRAKQEQQQQQQQQQSSQNLMNNNNSIMSPYAQQPSRQQSLQQLPKSYLNDHQQPQQSGSHQHHPTQHSGQSSYHHHHQHHVPNPSQPQYPHPSSTYPGQYSSTGNRYSSFSQANHSSGSNSSTSNPYSHSLIQQPQFYDAQNSNSHLRPLPSASGAVHHFGHQSGISSPSSSSYRDSRSLQKPMSQPVSASQPSKQPDLNLPPENQHHQENFTAANYSSLSSSSQGQRPIFDPIEPYRHRRFSMEPQVVHCQPGAMNELHSDHMVDGGTNGSKNSIVTSMIQNIKPNTMVDVQIFTDEFLEHNKMREQELRNLRSLTMDYEEANAISSKHIDDLIKANDLLQADNEKEQETNSKLKTILDQLQNTLVEHLGRQVPIIPEELATFDDGGMACKEPINLGNLDQYFQSLDKIGKNISNLTNSESLEKKRNEFVGSIRSAIALLDEVVI